MNDDASQRLSRLRPRSHRKVAVPVPPVLAAFPPPTIGIGLWMSALNLRSDGGAAGKEARKLEQEGARIRENRDSTACPLASPPDRPPSASGTAYRSFSDSSVFAIASPPPPRAGGGYQLRYLRTGGGDPFPERILSTDSTSPGFPLLAVLPAPSPRWDSRLHPLPTVPCRPVRSLSSAPPAPPVDNPHGCKPDIAWRLISGISRR